MGTRRPARAAAVALLARAQRPVCFVSLTAFNFLGADEWLPNAWFIHAVNSFDSQHPRSVLPSSPFSSPRSQRLPTFEDANLLLLQDQATATHLQTNAPDAGVMFLFFDERAEVLVAKLGLKLLLPSASFRDHLDSKITTTRLAAEVGVASVPHVLAPIRSFAQLASIASSLGPEWVVQLPYGDSGHTTFFVACEADFAPHAPRIAAQPVVKVMRRIRCRQLTIEACVTQHGVLVGPLMTELVGFPQMTPFRGGWCGNEVFALGASAWLTLAVRQQAQRMCIALGRRLKKEGYVGYFGIDILADLDSGALYLGELNPRITGATLLTSLAATERNEAPLLCYHLLEWLGEPYTVDVDGFNATWVAPADCASLSTLLIDALEEAPSALTRVPPSGVWRLQADGSVRFDRHSRRPQDVADDSEAFFFRTIDAGNSPAMGSCLGRVVLRGRVLTEDHTLTKRALAWVNGLRACFE